LEKKKGKDFEDMEYEPLFNYYLQYKERGCFKIKMADFVTTSDGTGIVHCATFGEEDFKMFLRYDMIDAENPPCPLDVNGNFVEPVTDFLG
jgi:isoleucyl-tRNA synthetase